MKYHYTCPTTKWRHEAEVLAHLPHKDGSEILMLRIITTKKIVPAWESEIEREV